MSPSDMPDFENMSPEEAMRWMESLARRQGANSEEFVTSADAEVADVDANAVVDEPGYIPFGQKEPDPPKKPAPPPAAAPPPPPVPAQPAEPEPTTINADLEWLSGLASDVGSTPDIPNLDDLDALTADLDLDNAFGSPTGSENDALSWLEGLASSQPEPTPPPAEPPAAQSGDVSNPLDAGIDPMAWLEQLARNQGAKDEELLTGRDAGMNIPTPPAESAPSPGYEAYDVDDEGNTEPYTPAASTEDWLGQLANDGAPAGGDPSLDIFGSMGGTDEPVVDEAEEDVLDASDPAAWLGDLANDPSVTSRIPKFDPNPRPTEPNRASTGDPIADMLNRGETPSPDQMEAWMSGKMDELLSGEPLPLPDEQEEDEPAIVPDPDAPPVAGEMPDWLQSMAPPADAESAPDSPLTLEPDPDALDVFAQSPITDAYEEKHEGSFTGNNFMEAEQQVTGLPDFLSMADTEAPVDAFSGTGEPSPLSDEIAPPPDVPDMPDWLMADVSGGETISDIFDTAEETGIQDEVPAAALTPDMVDNDLVARFTPDGDAFEDDTWVQAMKEEQQYNYQTDTLPQWYEERISDPVIRQKFEEMDADRLTTAELPAENELPVGQREPIPDWLTGASQQVAEAPAVADDMPSWLMENVDTAPAPAVASGDLPDWLADAGVEDVAASDIPDWLTETLPEPEPAPQEPPAQQQPAAFQAPPQQSPASTPAAQTYTPPPARPTSPVPVPQGARIDVGAVLTEARAKRDRGDINGALQDYERVVRANARLETVVAAVVDITNQKENKDNSAAYRVLGDALMRQGKLQAALDTYRKALNLL